jgi:DNA mismatch repair ATPase MutS
MREIRLAGTVRAIQIETITNRLLCGSAHERTTLRVEDESGQIEVIDQGACGRKLSRLKVLTLKINQQIDLLALIRLATNTIRSEPSLEVRVRFLDLARR